MEVMGWRPNRRNIVFPEKPDFVPNWVYTQAMVAKRKYNEEWDWWVWSVSKQYNVSISEAEDACIRGIKREILQYKHIYGDVIGDWFEQFMDMGDIYSKVKHPEYLPKLGD